MLRARGGAKPARAAAPLTEIPGFETPLSADWLWRPELWVGPAIAAPITVEGSGQRLVRGLSLFHDATGPEARIGPATAQSPGRSAAGGIVLEVGAFDGSFLSLALDLPASGISGVSRRHLLGASFRLDRAPDAKVFARFNLRHGPNTETLLRELPSEADDAGRTTVEFDLAYIEMNERRVTAAWLDVIFQSPADRRFRIDDVVLYRRPRAQL